MKVVTAMEDLALAELIKLMNCKNIHRGSPENQHVHARKSIKSDRKHKRKTEKSR